MTYVKKVKIFYSDNSNTLERDVNAFLSKEIEAGFSIISIQYQTFQFQLERIYLNEMSELTVGFSCMVYYSEPVED